MITLDTHALLWWALDPEKLSLRAEECCAAMEREGGFASSISFWELAVKIKNRKLEIGIPIEEFARMVKRTGVVEIVPVDEDIWLRNVSLEWDHRDPADRTIVATALKNEVPLLSKDKVMGRCSLIETIW